MRLSANRLVWKYGTKVIVDDVCLNIRSGEFFGLIGPNGSGKTTLISLIAGIRSPYAGEVFLDGSPLRSFSRRAIARNIALVEQNATTAERITVRQAVELGRTPYLNALSPWSEKDEQIVLSSLDKVGMSSFSKRDWHTLSGGERQRLHIARALAQEPEILLLDEPTNHLDIQHQINLLDLVRSQNTTVIAALHDLNHAAMFCDRIGMMQEGKLIAVGSPQEILTPERIRSVFCVSSNVEHCPVKGSFIRFHRPNLSKL